jgi:hypothetical protein
LSMITASLNIWMPRMNDVQSYPCERDDGSRSHTDEIVSYLSS